MQRILVQKFRQINEADVEIRDVVVLIGEQASGKSTLAKMIYFCKSLRQDYIDLMVHGEILIGNVSGELIKLVQNKFAVYFGYSTLLDKDFAIKYYFSVDEDEYVELFKTKSLQVKFSERLWQRMQLISKDVLSKIKLHRNRKFTSYQIQAKADSELDNYLMDKASELFHDRRSTLFFPAGRNITVSYPEQFQLLFYGSMSTPFVTDNLDTNTVDLRLMKDFIGYSKFLVDYYSDERHALSVDPALQAQVREQIEHIIHGKYKNEGGKERIFYNDDKFMPLSIASSGQQEVIRILQDLMYILNEGESTSRIIEEPETHLFPAAQASLLWLIIAAANKTKSQFILTTHSPYLLSVLNNFLYAGNIAKGMNEEERESLNQKTSEFVWLALENCSVHALGEKGDDGVYCQNLISPESGLIDYNELDGVSISMGEEFSNMQRLYLKHIKRANQCKN